MVALIIVLSEKTGQLLLTADRQKNKRNKNILTLANGITSLIDGRRWMFLDKNNVFKSMKLWFMKYLLYKQTTQKG